MMSVDLRADMGFKHIPQLQFPAERATHSTQTQSKSCFVQLAISMQQVTGVPTFIFPLHGSTCTHTFRRFFDGWLEAVHVVASVTVVTEQQLILR